MLAFQVIFFESFFHIYHFFVFIHEFFESIINASINCISALHLSSLLKYIVSWIEILFALIMLILAIVFLLKYHYSFFLLSFLPELLKDLPNGILALICYHSRQNMKLLYLKNKKNRKFRFVFCYCF